MKFEPQREQIVDEFEAASPAGHVHSPDVDQVDELRIVVVFEELQHGRDSFGRDQDLELVAGSQLHLLYELGHTLGHILAEVGEVVPLDGVRLPHRGPVLGLSILRSLRGEGARPLEGCAPQRGASPQSRT